MRARKKNNEAKKAGLPPGSLMHIGSHKEHTVSMQSFVYNEKECAEQIAENAIPNLDAAQKIQWINVDGVHSAEIIKLIGEQFTLHPLLQEDIMNTEQRPKMDEYDSYLFINLKMLSFDNQAESVHSEHMSLVLFNNCVISFQETPGDIFDPIRERLRTAKGKIRKMGADYLAYALIDAIVDNYFVILERIGDKLEEIEHELINDPTQTTLQRIYHIKRELVFLRKVIWPLREIMSKLQRSESRFIKTRTQPYVKDVYDHIVQVIDTIEIYRDVVSSMLDIYLSSLSNRMNEIMKVLTIISTIFIPLTFIVGVYGMNFKVMPEIYWKHGYLSVWIVMLIIAGFMLYYFRRKKWI